MDLGVSLLSPTLPLPPPKVRRSIKKVSFDERVWKVGSSSVAPTRSLSGLCTQKEQLIVLDTLASQRTHSLPGLQTHQRNIDHMSEGK